MSEQVEFEKVESGNSGASESLRGVVELPESVWERNNEMHCYVVFSEGISVEDGKELISEQVLEGRDPDIHRTDYGGNAIVVILTQEQYQKTSELSEVESITVIEEVELTEDTLSENTSEENESIEVNQDTSEANEWETEQLADEYETEELTTEILDDEYETEELTTENLAESMADSSNSFFENHIKGIRMVTIVVILIVLLVTYVQQKRRW